MKVKIFSIISVFLAILMSCNHDNFQRNAEIPETLNVRELLTGEPSDGRIIISATKGLGSSGLPYANFTAVFYEDGKTARKKENVGDLKIGNFLIKPDANNNYPSFFPDNKDFVSLFGTKQIISIQGNELNYGKFEKQVELPKLLEIKPLFSKLSTKVDNELIWGDGDPSEEILISLSYTGKSKGEILTWRQLVPDNGKYVIPAALISKFPSDEKIRLRLIRFNSYNVDYNQTSTNIIIYTEGVGNYKVE